MGARGTYGPGDDEGGACWDELASTGEGEGVAAGVATAWHGDGRRKAREGRGGKCYNRELHFGDCLESSDVVWSLMKELPTGATLI